jgi:prephenate dehydrogenase
MNIVIVGLGVIGGSFAQALNEKTSHTVLGVDRNPDTIRKALSQGIIAEGDTDPKVLLPQGDLTILAVYPQDVPTFLAENGGFLKPGSVLTDVSGIKGPLCRELDAHLARGVDFVLGHPMAGREKEGIDFASAQVFVGANYLIVPRPGNREESIRLVEGLIKELGFGRIRRISPEEHDRMIGFTSQLPHVLAVALINSDRHPQATSAFVGDSYRELTRIANINGRLWSQLFLGNRENLLAAMEDFEAQFHQVKEAIEKGDEERLMERFAESSKRRLELEQN